MLVTVERISSDKDTTISTVLIDGKFQCFGLEDEFREQKVAAETRIPAGLYDVGVRTVGGFHGRYKRKFSGMHKGMLHILNVPGFEYILIHVGNTDEDTAGCLLLGAGCYSQLGDMSLQSSVIAYKKFYRRVIASALAGNLQIEFIDKD